MRILICEDNLAGFLTAVYHCYYTYKNIDRITSISDSCTSFIDEIIDIETDLDFAKKVRAGIINKAGRSSYDEIADAYLSNDKNKEQKIYLYLRQLFISGKNISSMYANEKVIAFNDVLNKVRHEAHRMTGFLRFQEMDNGIFYSYFGTDNDVLELIVPHFITRFNSQKFILHDIKRKKIVFYDGAEYHNLIVPDGVNIELSEREKLFSTLWKEYYHNVSIANRKNIRQQDHFLPKKYRFFMNEF